MEATSQVILRNQSALPEGSLLLIDPPADDLCVRLANAGRALIVSTQDRAAWCRLKAAGIDARFEPVARTDGREQLAILFLPKEKERLSMALHAIAEGLRGDARLWLVGEKRAGIKSSPRHLQTRFDSVAALDAARHCGLFEAAGPKPTKPFELGAYAKDWPASFRQREIRLRSLPGVFAHGRLDAGTAALLDVLEDMPPTGSVLDFACGSGVVGLALKSAWSGLQLVLSDVSALALESARQSAALNDLEVRLLASDGLNEIEGRFDWIVSNPPFHRGVRDNLGVAQAFFARAGTFLNENGRIVVVFNRHLPYEHWIRQHFSRVRTLRCEGEYVVIQAGRR